MIVARAHPLSYVALSGLEIASSSHPARCAGLLNVATSWLNECRHFVALRAPPDGCVSTALSHEDVDAYADLNAEDVVLRAGEFGVFAHIATEVEDLDGIEVLREILAHSVEGEVVDEAVVADIGDDAFLSTNPIAGPADGFHIRIAEGVLIRSGRISGLGMAHAGIDNFITAILVVVVLV